jgi:phage N-6-adenine-methyltransferase
VKKQLAPLMSSDSTEWETPRPFFKRLDEVFHFTLDPCCRPDSALCETWYSKAHNGLVQDWAGHSVFMNPPYGRKLTAQWVEKAYREAQKPGTIVVALIPARTDTKWWHAFVMHAKEVRLVEGRIKFCTKGVPHKSGAPFPSAVVVFDGYAAAPVFSTMQR